MHSFEPDTVHIIGAGLAGLAAAVRLSASGRPIILYEATSQAGGRCRSYFDQTIGMTIDNGTHLLLSGNRAALSYLRAIGADHSLVRPERAELDFVDIAVEQRWKVRLNDGFLPWWIFDKRRRVPGTTARDYMKLARALWGGEDRPLSQAIECDSALFRRLVAPLLLAALNISPQDASSKLASAVVRETLAHGGSACRPMTARAGIGKTFIEPAIDFLRKRGVKISFEHELCALSVNGRRVRQLDFSDRRKILSYRDDVVLAVPAYAAAKIVPDIPAPTSFRGIVNLYFRIKPPEDAPRITGVINGTAEWIFAFPEYIAVTISDAGHLFDISRAMLAQKVWAEVSRVLDIQDPLPQWQIVRERRATFAATPTENAKRPPAETALDNLFLAGDWTATGLPATIEGAVRSGNRAADLVKRRQLARS